MPNDDYFKMTRIAKYNLKTILFPVLAVVLLLVGLGFVFAPSSDSFDWNSLNPLEAVGALAFVFGFALGLPDGVAVAVVVLFLILLWLFLFWLARKFVR